MDELQALMGDSYKEDLTIDDIKNFMKGKNFADLSTGNYIDVNKHNKEVGDLNTKLKQANTDLQSKMSDEERLAQEQKNRDDEIERLKALLSANTMTSNTTIANSSLTESVTLLGIKDGDTDFKSFVDNIVTEDTAKTTSVAKYVNKLVKDAYEKGKKDSTKNAMGEFGKQAGGSKTNDQEIGKLGKELAQASVKNNNKFDYFKQN